MMVYVVQLILCYLLVGLVMSGMLGLFPFGEAVRKGSVFIFSLFLITWLPASMLAILAAPVANMLRVQEENEW